MGQILAFVSGKGGTGKTSVCGGVAACLAAEGFRVLCIDCDVGLRNLDLALGMSDTASIPFTSVMSKEYSAQQIPEHPSVPGLFLLTAPVSFDASSPLRRDFRFMTERLREDFDYILIDAPAGVGENVITSCNAADRVIVVCNSDPSSLRDASSVSALLGDRPAGATRLVVNRVVPKMLKKMRLTLDDVIDETGLALLGIVPEDPSVPYAALEGLPLALYTGKGAARACLNISRRIRGLSVPLMRI